MSKGLGKVEKKILEWLEMKATNCKGRFDHCGDGFCGYAKPSDYGSSVVDLGCYVAGLYRCPLDTDRKFFEKQDYADSIYKSTLRAVRSLERKGYLSTEKINPHGKRGCLVRTNNWDYATREVLVKFVKR